MITNILFFIAGAITLGLVIRNNPSLAKKLGILVDKIEDEITELDLKSSSKKEVVKKTTKKSTNKKA